MANISQQRMRNQLARGRRYRIYSGMHGLTKGWIMFDSATGNSFWGADIRELQVHARRVAQSEAVVNYFRV